LRLAGAGLLAATGAIHLDLYLTGYRSIPVIGWLFLLQAITVFGLAVAALAGYLLSIWAGLFGFTEIRTTAGIAAGFIEVAAFAALAVLAAAPPRRPSRPGKPPVAAGCRPGCRPASRAPPWWCSASR
jgi:hypothetical protein